MITVVTPELHATPEMDKTGPQDIRRLSPRVMALLSIINTVTILCLGCAFGSAFIFAIVRPRGGFTTHIFLCTFGVSLTY